MSLSQATLLSNLNSAATPLSAAMAAEARQKIVSVALDMTNMLINMGLPEPKVREKAPPILFDLPQPKPLREPLLKLKLRKETVNRLNHIYISRTNEYLEATIRELQLLWSSVYVEGSHAPLRIWDKVILSAQEETQKTLDDMFDMVVASARDHVANLATMKRKSQPVFDQVRVERAYFQWLTGFAAHY